MRRTVFEARPSWQRSVVAAGFVIAVAGYPFTLEPSVVSLAFSLTGAILTTAALFGVPVQTACAMSFAAAYLVALLGAGVDVDPGAPLVALLLFGLLEALHHDGSVPDHVSAQARRTRAWSLVFWTTGGFIFSSLLLVAASAVPTSGPSSIAAGALLAVLLVGAIWWATKPLLADPDPSRQDR